MDILATRGEVKGKVTDKVDIDVQEREIRRRWHEAHIKRFDAEADQSGDSWRERNITPHA